MFSEDSQLLSQFHAWAEKTNRIAQREDAWLPEEAERRLTKEWDEVQNTVAQVYRGPGEEFA